MNYKVITDYLKNKGFKVLPKEQDHIISAYNITTCMVVNWVITNKIKRPHSIHIVYKDISDTRFRGNISNLQEFNSILNAVE